jgi:hypothetical protein
MADVQDTLRCLARSGMAHTALIPFRKEATPSHEVSPHYAELEASPRPDSDKHPDGVTRNNPDCSLCCQRLRAWGHMMHVLGPHVHFDFVMHRRLMHLQIPIVTALP